MNLGLYWENIIQYFEEEDWSLYEVNEEERTAITYIRIVDFRLQIEDMGFLQSKICNLISVLSPLPFRHVLCAKRSANA